MFYVYEHLRPDTSAVFYVGKGNGRRAHSLHGRNRHWRNIVAKAGGYAVRMVAENIDEELSFLIEVERIDQLRRLGFALCNMTDGGEGTSGLIPSNESRRKMSESSKGKVHSEETRRKMSKMRKGRAQSEETRRKISEGHKGIVPSEETRRKLSEAHKGRALLPRSEDYKRKMSEALKGRVTSEETRRRISEAKKGRRGSSAIAVQFDGKVFETVKALAEYIGKKQYTITQRVRTNPNKYGYVVLGRARDVLKDS